MICWLTNPIRPFQHPNTRWPHTLHMKVWRKQHIIKLPMKRCWRWQGEWMRRLKSNPCSGSRDTAVIVIGEWGTEDGSCCAEGPSGPAFHTRSTHSRCLGKEEQNPPAITEFFSFPETHSLGTSKSGNFIHGTKQHVFAGFDFFLRSAILFSDSTSPSSDYHSAWTQCNLLHL